MILANHGTVSWDTQSVERAFWYTEILEAYCRILLIAKQVGAVGRLSAEKVHELLELRTAIGFPPDRRQTEGVKGEALLTNAGFASEANRGYVHLHPDQLDNLAERIADKIGTRV
ncbi:MAG: class II aldolase/adducin family protein [Planctomycetota bacterium]